MRNTLSIFLLLIAFCSISLGAQSAPSATESRRQLWAGAEASIFNPDYGCPNNFPLSCSHDGIGAGAVASYDLRGRLAAAAEARWIEWNTSGGVTEATYLIGPQYRLWDRGSMSLGVNVLFGVGHASAPGVVGTYPVYAPGMEFEKRASQRFQWFVAYQYQLWPTFVGPPTTSSTGQVTMHNHGLTPNGFSVGLKYKVF